MQKKSCSPVGEHLIRIRRAIAFPSGQRTTFRGLNKFQCTRVSFSTTPTRYESVGCDDCWFISTKEYEFTRLHEFRHDFTDSRIVNSRAPSGWSLVSRKGRKEREDSSADEWSTPTTHLLLRSNEPMKFAKAPRCLYDETHAQRAYFAAFVQFAKQEDVNLHMKT